jgi:hypothetical protein
MRCSMFTAVVGLTAFLVNWNASLAADCACRKSNPDILVVQPAENWAAQCARSARQRAALRFRIAYSTMNSVVPK